MKSKFSIKILVPLLVGILLLYILSAVLIEVFSMPSIAFIVKAGTTIVSLVILMIFFRSAKIGWNRLRIDKDALYISPFMGLWTNKVSWDRVSGIERSLQQGEDTDTRILYIYIDNVRKIKISSDYYQNMYNVYRSLLRKTKVFGSDFTTLRRQSESEKPVSKLWILLAMSVPWLVMLGGFTYIVVEQIQFAKRGISATGSISAVHQKVALIWCFVGLILGMCTVWVMRKRT